ncbi:hypothetical protein ACF9IK_36235 [Kitasatospora hibisci]|uniref:hypothetical protein n=1 Tax=Kitasatospora hibisci TaxID=3369522 RepID=UPI003753EC12
METFRRMGVKDLELSAVVAQSLDNQWVPPGLLSEMLADGRSLLEVEESLWEVARADYIRSLLNSPQVLVNRAFLYNNPMVFRDFSRGSPDREAFISLLSSGGIVQILVNERTPADRPTAVDDSKAPNFSVLSDGWAAWSGVAGEAYVHSLKFDWADSVGNSGQIMGRLGRTFPQRVMSLVTLRKADLARDLGVSEASAEELKQVLRQVADACSELSSTETVVTREALYKRFVIVDRTEPAEGRYDPTKPYSGLIKQLLDLAYNVNLAVGIETLALTPAKGLHRTVLQEWEPPRRDPGTQLSAHELATLLRGVAFDYLQETMYLESFKDLSLRDVVAVRESDEWTLYRARLDSLLAAPLEMFNDEESGAAALMRSYIDVLQICTNTLRSHPVPGLSPNRARDFVVSIVVEAAGAALNYCLAPHGAEVAIAGAAAGPVAAQAANVVVRLSVRGWTGRHRQKFWTSELDSRVQVITGWVDSAQEFWEELLAQLDDVPGTEEAREILATRNRAAALEGGPEADTLSPI